MGDTAHALRTFSEHAAEIKAVIPAERLLVFRVNQGWEPMCDFLGVPVPEEPFPQVNDAEMLARMARSVARTLPFWRSR
ncbi:sulfotransferase [Nonomuraea sp. NEAU-A123]|uniref:sulfotransferase n=1 Tax=Nonomuraea sp. NEAU-A123 TaxID=2839649 RepID=UPI0027E16BAF|nr:sulfotransferase [Nonomuraea sp. NEAU-A123]